jgi:peptide deformylase
MSEEKQEFSILQQPKDNVVSFAEKVAQRMKDEGEKRKLEKLKNIQLEVVGANLQSVMTDDQAQIALNHREYFPIQNDLSMPDEWEGFTSCGYYDFNNFPIIEREEYMFGLEPVLFSHMLQVLAESRGDGDRMYHAVWMGQKYDAFVVKNPGNEGPTYEAFYNSQLLEVSEEEERKEEYSGFYPGLRPAISRPKKILVAWTDRDGENCLDVLEGDWARYFLQGYEQTRGRTFWKNADDIALQKAKEDRAKMLKGLEPGELK